VGFDDYVHMFFGCVIKIGTGICVKRKEETEMGSKVLYHGLPF